MDDEALAAVASEGEAEETVAAADGADTTIAAEGEDTVEAADAEPTRQVPFVPTYDTSTPEGLDARLTAIQTEQATIKAEQKALKVKFGTGDMTPQEWADQDEALQDKRDALAHEATHWVGVKTRAEMVAQQNQQTMTQAIDSERKAFFRDAKKEGIDYSDAKLRTKLDIAFNAIANHPDNASRTVNDAYDTFVEAHQLVKAQIGWKAPAPAAVPTPKANAPRNAPQTLANIPAAAAADTGDDTLAKFNALQGEDAERYLASLPKKEVERMLKLAS
jgi:hypothetical protein